MATFIKLMGYDSERPTWINFDLVQEMSSGEIAFAGVAYTLLSFAQSNTSVRETPEQILALIASTQEKSS